MTRSRLSVVAVSLFATAAATACTTALQSAHTSVQPSGSSPLTPAEQARADSGRMAFTAADVHFMQGMIHHHAQAVVMAGWAQTNGARTDVKTLAERSRDPQRHRETT